MCDAATGVGKLFDLILIHVNGVREPNIVPEPSERLHPLHGPLFHVIQGVAFLVQSLAEMGMQSDFMLSGESGRIFQQGGRDREW